MWLLFHGNAKTRTVRDGHTFVETCPACHARDVLGGLGHRQLRRVACPARDRTDAERMAAVAEQRRIAAERERRDAEEARGRRIEDERAALEKRLGR